MNDLITKGKKIFTFTVVLTTIVWSIGIGALALPLAANAVTSGDLIKGTGTAVYYYGADAKRYVFPYQASYTSWYTGFGTVTTMTDADLIAIPFGGNVTVHPGKLVQVVSMDTPWAVMDPKVYAVSKGGVLHWVKTAALASSIWGVAWEGQIVAVPESLLTNYTIGSEINNASDYSLATEMAVGSINEDKGLTGAGGDLSVSLASDTAMSASVPKGAANVPFTKVNFTAGAADVTITGLKVTRSGLGTDANISAVKLFVNGLQRGTSQSLGSSHQASFSLTSNPITVAAGTTVGVVLAADIVAAPTAYDQHIFGVANVADITTTASIAGTFPINGNVMSLVNSTIGTATITPGPLNPTDAGNVDPDATGYRFSQIKIAAGSTEPIVVGQLTAIKNGTAANSDIKNIVLYNDTSSTVLGTVAALDGNGRAVFNNLNLQIAKGAYVELSLKADMSGTGSGRTIGLDVHDGTSMAMTITGGTYGFGILPTATAAFCLAGRTDYTCPRQNINQGYLTISKSASAPATGQIPVGGTGIPLMAFDFVVAGEPVNVSQTALRYTTTTGLREEVTNVTLYKADGTILAGPKNGSNTGAGVETLTFTDAYTLPVGTTIVYVKADMATTMSALDQIMVDMQAGSVTAKGANSGKTTYTTSAGTTVPPAAAITGNTMTLQGPALTVITAATPVASNMVVNAQDQVFAYFDLDASAGGEDIRVSTLTVTDTLGAGVDYTGINNLELWGDPDTSDSTTANERLMTSNSTATNGATTTFTFQTPIVVGKNVASRLTLKADVVATTGTSHAFKVNATGDFTATGKTTGNTATKAVSGAGQAQTIQASGLLKVEMASDVPSAAQLVSASTGNEVMKYKFSATYEPIDVTTFKVFCGNNLQAGTLCTNRANVAKIYVYADGVLIGNASGYTLDATGLASVVLNSGTLVIPKDGYKVVTLKVDLPDRTQVVTSSGASGSLIQIGLEAATTNGTVEDLDNTWGDAAGDQDYWIVATGQSSGVTISKDTINSTTSATSGQVFASNGFSAHKGILTVSLNASSPNGTQTPGANKEVLRLNLVATGDDIVVRELELVNSGTATITGTGSLTVKSDDGGTTYATVTSANANTYGGSTAPLAAQLSIGPFGCTVGAASATGDACAGAWAAADNLTVAAGTTKVVRIYGDTTGAASTTTYQMSVSNSAANKTTTYGVTYYASDAVPVGNRTGSADMLHPATKNLPLTGGSLTY